MNALHYPGLHISSHYLVPDNNELKSFLRNHLWTEVCVENKSVRFYCRLKGMFNKWSRNVIE